VKVEPSGPLLLDVDADIELAIRMAIAGKGVIHLFEELLGPHIEGGALEPVLRSWWRPFVGAFLFYPDRSHLSAPLRAFIDFVKSRGVLTGCTDAGQAAAAAAAAAAV